MIKGFVFFWGILILFTNCGSRRSKDTANQQAPLSVASKESEKNKVQKDSLEANPISENQPSDVDSKPLKSVLVIFTIQPNEMSLHVPVRTKMPAFGVPIESSQTIVSAYPSPSDISANSSPVALNKGYFLDRTGFVGAGTRFLDMHFDAYQGVSQEIINTQWFNDHLIPREAMQLIWYTCDCDQGDLEANTKLLNSMIEKGIEKFKHPELSTHVHPKYGSQFPKN